MVEALIYTCIRASLQFQDILHRFRDGRGTGTAIMDLDLTQELAILDHDPLLLVFLDLRNAYNTIDRDRRIQTFEGSVAVPFLCGLLENFWSHKKVVPRQKGYRGPAFPATKVTTQGGLVSLTLFNIVVDNFIRTWLGITV